MIGDDVTITILGVRGGQIRVGVSAPKETPVHREEVYEKMRKEGAAPVPQASIGAPSEDTAPVRDAGNVVLPLPPERWPSG